MVHNFKANFDGFPKYHLAATFIRFLVSEKMLIELAVIFAVVVVVVVCQVSLVIISKFRGRDLSQICWPLCVVFSSFISCVCVASTLFYPRAPKSTS